MKDMVQVRRGRVKEYTGPDVKIGRSQFNRSHGLKTTFNAGYLYPIFVDDVLPGDTMTMSINGFVRMFSPLKAPMMDNITLETFFFFVPNRLVWSNWKYFQGEHDAAGAQDTTYTVPVLATGWTVDHDSVVTGHGLAAHMGLPHGMTSASVDDVSALPFRAYIRCYNDWFRDQNLTAEYPMITGDGPDSVGSYAMRVSAKKHDYFTSALPYLQKGTAITATLVGQSVIHAVGDVAGDISIWSDTGAATKKLETTASSGLGPVDISGTGATESTTALYAQLDDTLSGGTVAGIDVNALRQSIAIQRLLEKDARGGTRYVESIYTHFGVTSPDFRLQRTEYLGGGKSFINISPVATTQELDAAQSINAVGDIHQGTLSGIGAGVVSGHSWSKSFTEHGHIIGIVRARGDITYFQGVDRFWTRSTRYDFYIPSLANLGEQSILNKEIWVSNDSNDVAVFGYQERWSEYRMKHSRVAGNFNPDVTGSLAHWHLAEDFGSLPALNTAFVQDGTPMTRVQAVTTEPSFLADLWFNYKCARPIPVNSIPSLQARF